MDTAGAPPPHAQGGAALFVPAPASASADAREKQSASPTPTGAQKPLAGGARAGGDVDVPPAEEEWTCLGWVFQIAEEIAFSTGYRLYVYGLLLANLTFVLALGYNLLLALTYRMLVPPTDQQFLASFGMMCGFWTMLIITSTFIALAVQLIASWMSLSRTSVNVFFIPNEGTDELDAIQTRNNHLLWFEIITLVVPFFYGIIRVAQGNESFVRFVGHFSFCGFVGFECLVLLCWLYFWVRSLRTKRQAWREGRRLLHLAKDNEPAPGWPRGGAASEDEREMEEHDAERGEQQRGSRVSNRRQAREGSEDSDDRGATRAARARMGESGYGTDESPPLWHRRVLSNPFVMAEFGTDLYSVQAYFVHILIGLGWVLVASYPLKVSVDNIAWLAIILGTIIGGFVLLYQNVSKSRARKVALRQRRVALALIILWIVVALLGLASAFATSVWFGLALVVGLAMTQMFMVRRHDMHVREPWEAGAFYFPETDWSREEMRKRTRAGAPSVWIPLLPCGQIWRACCSGIACFQPEKRDIDGDKKIFKQLQRRSNRRHELLSLVTHRDGCYDKIPRPVALPRYSTETIQTPAGKVANLREHRLNKRERVLSSNLMVQTWYFAFFLVAVGFAYAAGNFTTPENLSSTPAVLEANAGFPGVKSYLACSMAWGSGGGDDRDLSLVDLALLTHLADGDAAAIEGALTTWFNTPRKIVRLDVNGTDTASKAYQASNGAPVGWATFSGYTSEPPAPLPPRPDYHVVVVRHAGFGKQWMRDVDAWGDAVTYQMLSALNPFFALWPDANRAGFVEFLGAFKKALHQFHEMEALEAHVRALVDGGRPVYLTGHGAHGGWAKLLAHKLRGAVPVVTFGAPGIQWTSGKYGISLQPSIQEVNIAPESALLDGVDRHTGFVQQTACDGGNSMTGCQSMQNMVCDLLRACGDPLGRYFEGFPAEAGVAAAGAICEYDI